MISSDFETAAAFQMHVGINENMYNRDLIFDIHKPLRNETPMFSRQKNFRFFLVVGNES